MAHRQGAFALMRRQDVIPERIFIGLGCMQAMNRVWPCPVAGQNEGFRASRCSPVQGRIGKSLSKPSKRLD